MKIRLFALASLLCAQPLLAQSLAQDPLAPLLDPPKPAPQPKPANPPPASSPPAAPAAPAPLVIYPPAATAQPATPAPAPVRIPRDWREVFTAIHSGNWASASAGIAVLPPSVLTPVAKAELYTAKGSPTVDLPRLQALLAEAPELPQAEQIARMAYTRGATTVLIVPKRPLAYLGSPPARYRARPVQGEPAADQLRAALDPLIKADAPADAELLFTQSAPLLSYEARAEAAQRVAWAYYVDNRDADARRVADSGRLGASGEWAAQAAWISGLASWRLNDCEAASRAFREVASIARERELSAGAYYWAARAEQACRRPRSVAPLLRAAAQSNESFYGLIARETLGLDTRLPAATSRGTAAPIDNLPNVQRAQELVRIGERGLAEEMLRHQARICRPSEHHALIEVAQRLELPGTQFWLAHNGQPGAVVDARDRYPMPQWTPVTGWRVDPALAFAHVIQESTFRADAVSPAGAVGLMQVLPGTAQDMALARSLPFSRSALTDPSYNLEFGQSFIEQMRRSPSTGGQLPRMMAAYNAGPTPVARWAWIADRGDPLVWIESIPYWETRYYVPAVFRNMWVYQGLAGAGTPTLDALVQHRWPDFPSRQTILSQQASALPATR